MTESFMTTEGDRSGVATPSKDEKALNKLKAAMEKLRVIEKDWARVSPSLRAIAISEVRRDLAGAVTLLMGGDANT